MAFLIGGANSAADTGYDVANSCKFDGTSAYLAKTPGSNGTSKTFTISVWIKRCKLGATQTVFSNGDMSDGNPRVVLGFNSSDQLDFLNYESGVSGRLVSQRKFRDPSAWYHVLVNMDTTESTAGDRMRMYINGTEETVFDTDTNPSLNADSEFAKDARPMEIGIAYGNDEYFDGYMAEYCVIDGSQLAASSFGEFDEDSPTIWKPKDVSGLTFGTHGFYLDFEDSANLGNDANGGTDLDENNIAAADQSSDSPTNNFCTLNPADNNNNTNLPTLSEGNLEVISVSDNTWSITPGTIALPKSGKWYYEVEAVSGRAGDRSAMAGWANPAADNPLSNGSMFSRNSNGNIMRDDTSIATGYTTWQADGDILGCYIDMDNSKLYWAMNGTIQASGTGISFDGGFDDEDFILPMVQVINLDKLSVNFGNPATNFAIASGNADANGYGNFEFDPSDGGNSSFDSAAKDFYAICTKNLAEFG